MVKGRSNCPYFVQRTVGRCKTAETGNEIHPGVAFLNIAVGSDGGARDSAVCFKHTEETVVKLFRTRGGTA